MPGARRKAPASERGISARIGKPKVAAGIAALAIGFALKAVAPLGTLRAEDGPHDAPGGVSVVAKTYSNDVALRAAHRSPTANGAGMRLASLESDVAFDAAADAPEPPAPRILRASFDERFGVDASVASFGERFAGVVDWVSGAAAETDKRDERAHDVRLALADPGEDARPAVRSLAAPARAPISVSLPARASEKRETAAMRDATAPSDADRHTAIYDIAAHTVYLPDGHRLEAHSGRGSYLDDPRAIRVKGRGPTPPNVYELSLREKLFHGVRALRLTPIGDAKMFGRDGMLAHTYMLGRNGQSMGCVSFSNYPAFLTAYLKGDVNRLIVVEHLANAPNPKTASDWIPASAKTLLTRS